MVFGRLEIFYETLKTQGNLINEHLFMWLIFSSFQDFCVAAYSPPPRAYVYVYIYVCLRIWVLVPVCLCALYNSWSRFNISWLYLDTSFFFSWAFAKYLTTMLSFITTRYQCILLFDTCARVVNGTCVSLSLVAFYDMKTKFIELCLTKNFKMSLMGPAEKGGGIVTASFGLLVPNSWHLARVDVFVSMKKEKENSWISLSAV